MHVRTGILAGILFCISAFLHAQNLVTAYSVEEGLPQSTVTALYRDDDGYLWCGTGSGIGIYDGWEFHSPRTDSEKANPDLNSIIRGIIPSADGKTVWAGSESVLMQFDRYSYRVLRSFDVVRVAGVGEVPVYANDTAVWLMCWGNGLFRVRINDGKVTQLTANGFMDNFGMTADNRSVIFPDTTRQFIIYDLFSNTVKRIPKPAEMQSLTINFLVPLPGSSTEVLIGTTRGMWKMDMTTGVIGIFHLGDPRYDDISMGVNVMDVHPDGSWWIAFIDRGIFRYDPVQRTLRPCLWQQDGTYMGNLLTSPKSLVCDAYGVVWYGTDGSGLIKLLHSRVTFRSKYTNPFITDTCNWFVRSFYEMSPGRYLVGTYRNGIHLIDEHAASVTHITSGPLWEQRTPHFITAAPDGKLIVGTEDGVLELDTTTWQTKRVTPGISMEGQRMIGCIRLRSGQLMVYGNTGLSTFIPGEHPALSEPIRQMGNITGGIELSDGRIVFATYYNGLQELSADQKTIRRLDYLDHVGVPNTTNIHGMVEDEAGNLWLASESGLLLLDNELKLIRTFTTADGISDNTIYELIALNRNTLVLATGHGVTMFDTKSWKATVYSGPDGLPSEECNTGALLYAASGKLYIGTTAGFVSWDPREASVCFRPASVVASYSDNEPDASGIIRESIVRDYGSGNVELRVWLTDFAFTERSLYTYQLEGADTGKTVERGLRKVNFAALGPGSYAFLCSAAVPGCETTGLQKLLTIKIVPPFWMSGWFIVMSSVGVVVIITLTLFILMRMNYQRKLRKLKMQQELDRVRARISRDIHDEIGAGLTRIALSGDLMSKQFNTADASHDRLKVIAGTARELSQSMKEVVWSVNPHYDSLDHMAAYFRSYVSGVAENADVRFVYVADEKLPSVPVNPEARRNLLLILKEVVSNAAKYAEAKSFRLEMLWHNEIFTLRFEDDGKGFDLEGSTGVNSNGLRNIRQRAEASGMTVKIFSAPGKGTKVQISGSVQSR